MKVLVVSASFTLLVVFECRAFDLPAARLKPDEVYTETARLPTYCPGSISSSK